MELLYAVSLILALVAGALSVIIGVLVRMKSGADQLPAARLFRHLLSIRAAVVTFALGTLSLVISVVVHLESEHGPTSPRPMELGRLLSEHESFVVAAVVLALGFALTAYTEWRRRDYGDA